MAEPSSAPTPSDAAPTPPEERVRLVLEQIRPFLQRDGGDLEYVSYDDGVVSLRLQGACTSCPSSSMTLKMGIERALKEQIPEVKEVIPVA